MKNPQLHRLLLLLLAILLGYGSWFVEAYRIPYLGVGGFVLGFMDRKRGWMWGLATLLPHAMVLGPILTDMAMSGNGRGIPFILISWGYGYLYPTVHAIFGGCLGGWTRWVVSRLRDSSADRHYPHTEVTVLILNPACWE